jgi:endothelin-converting enzyme
VVVTKSYVLNALILARSHISKKWASLNKPFAKGQFVLSTLVSNAGHSPTENAMLIHAAIQQAPLYHPGYPAYLAYGGMGSVVGHEITHGFDGNGHRFDKTGNFSSWFDEQSSKGFAEATQCFVKQYSNFTVTDPDGTENKIDGQLTANENIADAGGVLASYAAWKRYEEQSGKALDLPGLAKWTHEQLFFIKYGQNWCENLGSMGSNDVKDVHAPLRSRILLPLENSVDFQKAFNCPKKEPTCELW